MLAALSIILSITILELILSVDNALVNASLAEDLPPHLQKKAIYWGIGMGAIFRIICLFIATLIIQNPIIKVIGGLYLIYLAFSHFLRSQEDATELRKHPHFNKVIVQIALADLVFSIDNIVGVIGLSSHFAYIVIGVLIGIIAMIFITSEALKLMNAFPTLTRTAYGIIAYIGFSILVETFLKIHISEYVTFGIILLSIASTIFYDKYYSLTK